MTRLLLATGLYPPEAGGPATYAKLLEDRLPEKEISVTVVPFRVVRHLPPVIRHFSYAWKLWRLASQHDALLVQDTVSTGLPAAIVARVRRMPLIVRVPGDYAWEQGVQRAGVHDTIDAFQDKRYGVLVGTLRAVQNFVVRSATRVIVPSAYLGRIVARWVPGIATDVIYNGISLPETSESAREENLIVSIGRLVPWKGFGELIAIVRRHPAWKVVIIGDGPERSALEKLAEGSQGIIFTGQIENDAARAWFRRASVFVLNSTYEGLSHALVEALAEGAPVIATNVGGNPEVVSDPSYGRLVAPGDMPTLEAELVELLGNTEMRAALEKGARERARAFSVDVTVEQTASLIHACTSHRQR